MESEFYAQEFPLQKIVSGGQTGVDRAALDAAIFLEIEHGGWCPKGRRAEDGPIAPVYQLIETEESDYSIRTRKNVVDSDGTLILCHGPLTGGTRLTLSFVKSNKKPFLIIDFENDESGDNRSYQLIQWIKEFNVQVLNIAGPRESTTKGIGKLTEELLVRALQ